MTPSGPRYANERERTASDRREAFSPKRDLSQTVKLHAFVIILVLYKRDFTKTLMFVYLENIKSKTLPYILLSNLQNHCLKKRAGSCLNQRDRRVDTHCASVFSNKIRLVTRHPENNRTRPLLRYFCFYNWCTSRKLDYAKSKPQLITEGLRE